MNKQSELNDFLRRNRISKEEWNAASLSWEELCAIGEDHKQRFNTLEKTATLLANIIQSFEKVHSVRWRVKNVEHLLAKIVRKRIEGNSKYKEISISNYTEIVTDLIGIRAIHLFKSEILDIDKYLRSCLDLLEDPVAYVRDGDDQELRAQYQEMGLEVKNHPKGYRSIHYVATSKPFKQAIHVEIQVRTIFEEGWSEIDHTLRYPNFSDNVQVAYLLTILNRMAGSADELGGFVKVLAKELADSKQELEKAILARDQSVRKMEEALEQLEKEKSEKSAAQIDTVKDELAKIKKETTSRVGGLGDEMRKWISVNGIDSSLHQRINLDSISVGTSIGSALKEFQISVLNPAVGSASKFGLDDAIKEQLKNVDPSALWKEKMGQVGTSRNALQEAVKSMKNANIDVEAIQLPLSKKDRP